MASKNNCAGCMSALKSKEYLQCSTCNLRYDLLCSNITVKRFKVMKVADKAIWKCQVCTSKLPKTNNIDTPVRLTRTDSPANSPDDSKQSPITPVDINITNRNKRHQSSPLSPMEDDTILELTKSSFRKIIRQEIASALKEAVAVQFKQISDLVSSFRTSLDFFNDKYEEMKVTLDNNTSKIQVLERENIKLQSLLYDYNKRINLMEQHNRSTNIEVQNVPENRSENIVIYCNLVILLNAL
ncbi:hypothetical protein PYW08_012963 [Mythimna loreyi]|uniref:Uncharacterized protein n=1 Tax=Mythimna loreyi TaxID=667449 RepID=A0ACC2PZ71_9NEOP|nr:hypothetical protein PYW08_012963 [Mythimna loreyi]